MNQIYDAFRASVDPICIIFILLVISFFVVLRSSKKKSGALLLLLAIVLLYGFSIEPVSSYLSWKLEKDYIQNPASSKKPLDVVVVLSGGGQGVQGVVVAQPAQGDGCPAANARYNVTSSCSSTFEDQSSETIWCTVNRMT